MPKLVPEEGKRRAVLTFLRAHFFSYSGPFWNTVYGTMILAFCSMVLAMIVAMLLDNEGVFMSIWYFGSCLIAGVTSIIVVVRHVREYLKLEPE